MKLQSYQNFWQRIHKVAQVKSFPLRVMFELTYRCNFKCRHCYVPKGFVKKYKRKELKTKEVFSILDQLKELGCFYLGFTGGEPFLRPDIIDILGYAKQRGFEVIIYTNGSLIDKKMAEYLFRLRPNKVDITIPAISEEAFRQVTGVNGAREAVFNAIRFLHKKNINVAVKTCVVKTNESEIDGIRRFAGHLGIFHRVDDYPSARLDGSKAPYRLGTRTVPESLESQECGAMDNCNFKGSKKAATIKDLFKCGAGFTQAAITPAGELKLCLMIDYPKYRILEISLNEAWQRLGRFMRSIALNQDYKCDKCLLRVYCNWCPAEAWLEKKTFVDCNLKNKLQAEVRYHAAHRA